MVRKIKLNTNSARKTNEKYVPITKKQLSRRRLFKEDEFDGEVNTVSEPADLSKVYELADNVRKQAEEIANYINEHSYILAYTDNKLHYVYPETLEEEIIYYAFLEDSWDMFKEYLDQVGCETKQADRSEHRFYINSKNDTATNFLDELRYDRNNRPCTAAEVIAAYYEAYLLSSRDEVVTSTSLNCDLSRESINNWYYKRSQVRLNDNNGYEFDIEDCVPELEEELDNYTSLKQDLTGELEDIVDAYDYVENFKDNQEDMWQQYKDNNLREF